MKKRRSALLHLAGIVLAVLFLPGIAFTPLGTAVCAAGEPVADSAGLFSQKEIQELTEKARSLSQKAGMDVVIVTEDDTGGKTSQDYADDYYDYNGYDTNGVLLLLDMDNRQVYISTSGRGITYLTDRRIDSMLDRLIPYMKKEDYSGAAQRFLSDCSGYLTTLPSKSEGGTPAGPPVGSAANKWTRYLPVYVVAALAAGGISVLIVWRKYRVKPKRMAYDFRSQGHLNLVRQDSYLTRTWVTTREVPKSPPPSSSGGGSSTHTSSSGSTHGGRGRGF